MEILKDDACAIAEDLDWVARRIISAGRTIQSAADGLKASADEPGTFARREDLFKAAVIRLFSIGATCVSTADYIASGVLDADEFGVWRDSELVQEGKIQVSAEPDALLVKLPVMPPSAVYAKTHLSSVRWAPLVAMLRRMPLPDLKGKLLLYIVHSRRSGSSWRQVPDFDNFDVKGVIDAILNCYRGDNMGQYDLLSTATNSTPLPEGTYALLVELPKVIDRDGLLRRLEATFGNLSDRAPAVERDLNAHNTAYEKEAQEALNATPGPQELDWENLLSQVRRPTQKNG